MPRKRCVPSRLWGRVREGGAFNGGASNPPPRSPPARAGLSHMADHSQEECIVPSGPLDLAAQRCGMGMRSHDIEGEPAQDGEVFRSIVFPRAIGVLREMDVEHPMQAILDA